MHSIEEMMEEEIEPILALIEAIKEKEAEIQDG